MLHREVPQDPSCHLALPTRTLSQSGPSPGHDPGSLPSSTFPPPSPHRGPCSQCCPVAQGEGAGNSPSQKREEAHRRVRGCTGGCGAQGVGVHMGTLSFGGQGTGCPGLWRQQRGIWEQSPSQDLGQLAEVALGSPRHLPESRSSELTVPVNEPCTPRVRGSTPRQPDPQLGGEGWILC